MVPVVPKVVPVVLLMPSDQRTEAIMGAVEDAGRSIFLTTPDWLGPDWRLFCVWAISDRWPWIYTERVIKWDLQMVKGEQGFVRGFWT